MNTIIDEYRRWIIEYCEIWGIEQWRYVKGKPWKRKEKRENCVSVLGR